MRIFLDTFRDAACLISGGVFWVELRWKCGEVCLRCASGSAQGYRDDQGRSADELAHGGARANAFMTWLAMARALLLQMLHL